MRALTGFFTVGVCVPSRSKFYIAIPCVGPDKNRRKVTDKGRTKREKYEEKHKQKQNQERIKQKGTETGPQKGNS